MLFGFNNRTYKLFVLIVVPKSFDVLSLEKACSSFDVFVFTSLFKSIK